MSVDNLLKALDDEYKGYSFYFASSDFGQPFTNLLEVKANHINALIFHLNSLNAPVPPNPYSFNAPGNLEIAITTALQNEQASIELYNTLSVNESDPQVLDTFYRLQADSYNNHIPALQNSLSSLQNSKILEQLNQGKALLDEISVMVNKLKDGSLSQGELEGFLGKLNYGLIGGAIMGAFGVIIANELLNKDKE
ncbi:hypothetical protein V2I29_08035 [Campylobacter sp. CX2-8023-23]|uniref:hypothetical protein n=1 Tax=Campylobacter porcelli TaxID=1660073 RepID=UPI002EA1BD5C|nr:hypothetical protein [Campylobacter sp. CX2-8023-23]